MLGVTRLSTYTYTLKAYLDRKLVALHRRVDEQNELLACKRRLVFDVLRDGLVVLKEEGCLRVDFRAADVHADQALFGVDASVELQHFLLVLHVKHDGIAFLVEGD